MSATDIHLQIRGLNKNFGGIQAISDVTLDLPAGVITTLVGPNGAGKTTLFNLITGHLLPTTGTVHWLGTQVNGIEPWRRRRTKCTAGSCRYWRADGGNYRHLIICTYSFQHST